MRLISEDVIHSFFVPACRVKQEVLPGRYATVWFEPTRIGSYRLFCAEYCGAKHSETLGWLRVVTPADYQRWLAGGANEGEPPVGGLLARFGCLNCHVDGGAASRGPALEGLFGRTVRLQDGQTLVADATYVRESILRPQAKIVAGYGPLMPAFEGQMNEETLNRLLAEIRGLSGSSAASSEIAP